MSAWNYIPGYHQNVHGFTFPAAAQQYPPGWTPNQQISQYASGYGAQPGWQQQTPSQPINIPRANPSGLVGNQNGHLGFTMSGTPVQGPQFPGYMAYGYQQPYTAPR